MHPVLAKYQIVILSILFMFIVTILSFSFLSTVTCLVSLLLGLAMSVIIYTDARYFIIPDTISLPMVPAGILTSAFFAEAVSFNNAILLSAAAATLGFLMFYLVKAVYLKIRKVDGLGMGDVKIAAVAGAWTGATGLNAVVLISCILALAVISFFYLLGYKVSRRAAIPFGVFLAPAIWFVWYLQVIGYFNSAFFI